MRLRFGEISMPASAWAFWARLTGATSLSGFEIRNSKPEIRKARQKLGLNAETQRTQRDAEKQETANVRMQKTPNPSAILGVLCVSALEFGFG